MAWIPALRRVVGRRASALVDAPSPRRCGDPCGCSAASFAGCGGGGGGGGAAVAVSPRFAAARVPLPRPPPRPPRARRPRPPVRCWEPFADAASSAAGLTRAVAGDGAGAATMGACGRRVAVAAGRGGDGGVPARTRAASSAGSSPMRRPRRVVCRSGGGEAGRAGGGGSVRALYGVGERLGLGVEPSDSVDADDGHGIGRRGGGESTRGAAARCRASGEHGDGGSGRPSGGGVAKVKSEADSPAAQVAASVPAQRAPGPALADAAALLALVQGALSLCNVPLGPARTEDTGSAGNSECPKQVAGAAAGDVSGVTSPEAAAVCPPPASLRVGLGPSALVAQVCAGLSPSSASALPSVPGNDNAEIEASANPSPGGVAGRAGADTLTGCSCAAGLARAPAGSRCVLPAKHEAF
jgi:hypothetical protein